ncbi:MAG TPA: 50S ribosomal protein L25/general stress protein Ctc [Myxococcales bacterium]|nr:50S ribosomal protein L25/general stress protein Ctc [Myxococcales bacterium]
MTVQRTELSAKNRSTSGKGAARKLRAQGMIPAVVYGRHLEAPAQIAVEPAAVKKAIATSQKFNTLIALKVDGGDARQVLLKDYQQDPVSRELLHADFIEVRETEPVKVKVPLVLVGRAEGVGLGGILSQNRRDLEVWALPGAIPEKIEADVTHLKIAQALHINDIKMPEGVKVKTHVNFTIAVVTAPEKEEAAPAPAAAVAAAPGAAPAEGAAPAAGAAAPAAGGKAGEKGAAPAAGGKAEPAKKEEKKK